MKRIAIAYFWLCVLASALAVFGWRTWLYFDHNADFLVIWVVFMFLVHIRAYLVADEYFQKKVRAFRPSVSAIGGSRPVPVGGLFEFALPGRRVRQQKTIDLDDGPSSYVVGEVVLSSGQVDLFVKKAWMRQRSGKPGLSRTFWVKKHRPTWDRAEYEAVVRLLEDGGFVVGRRPGASDKLRLPSAPLLERLRSDFGGR